MSDEPAWLIEAGNHIGKSEIPGPRSNSWIETLWRKLLGGAWYWTHFGSDDSVLPWCGAFVAFAMQSAGIPYPKGYARARDWLNWGIGLAEPRVGCVVVFERGAGGHVGFVVGRTARGQLLVLGGNQGDRVCIAPFSTARVLGYRWPPGVALPYSRPAPLAILADNGEPLSINEA